MNGTTRVGDILRDDLVFDMSVIEEMIEETTEEIACQVVEIFLRELDSRIDRICAHWKSDDIESLSREAHAIKSSSATVGLQRLSALTRDLEKAAEENDRNAIGPLMDHLPREGAAASAALSAFLASSPSRG